MVTNLDPVVALKVVEHRVALVLAILRVIGGVLFPLLECPDAVVVRAPQLFDVLRPPQRYGTREVYLLDRAVGRRQLVDLLLDHLVLECSQELLGRHRETLVNGQR
jgi:hypothetical protein